jgi:hypothetical protein
MIKYALVCENGHEFESWFSNADGYDTQVQRGFVECPHCRSKQVTKALMAPSVSTSRRREAIRASLPVETDMPAPRAPDVPTPPAGASAPMALLDERQQATRAVLRELHEKLTANSTDVGETFPEEARRMQAGEAPTRQIHGRASLEEARALVEEGIPVLPLPVLPDERN